MSRREVQHITLDSKSTSEKKGLKGDQFMTAEGIPFKSIYSKEDVDSVEHLNFVAGIPPFLRGPYSTMYVRRCLLYTSPSPRDA